MTSVKQILRYMAISFFKSPAETLCWLGRRCLYTLKEPAQVVLLQKIVRETPLLLQIETNNVCNSACIFCAYKSMKRKKGVMSLALFEKIVREYVEMGGGPVSLTPLMGDALLDPHLLKRLQILTRHPEINQITLTTNAIALERYSDEEICQLLSALYFMQVSVGGLDSETYKTMYGVDQFPRVKASIARLIRLNRSIDLPAHLTVAFRTNDCRFEAHFKKELDEYKKEGVFVSHISTYANYAGAVSPNAEKNLVLGSIPRKKVKTCVSVGLSLAICWDGTITACGCADFEGDKLTIGNAETDKLTSVWSGENRLEILESFNNGKLFPICRQCSAYTPDTVYASSAFNNVQPHQPLPLDFFRKMMS